ncbi:hypothetical protein [Neobacillus sp. SAB-20_R2A]
MLAELVRVVLNKWDEGQNSSLILKNVLHRVNEGHFRILDNGEWPS